MAAWEVADILWLASARQDSGLGRESVSDSPEPDKQPAEPPLPDTRSVTDVAESGAAPARPTQPVLEPLEWEPGEARFLPQSIEEPGWLNEPDEYSSVPLVEPAHGSLEIVRALRPLKRTVLSWRPDDVVLDEETTAERAVQDGLWWPVTKPNRERCLDLTLIIDDGPSMSLWRTPVAAFASALLQLGAFRTIQTRLLDTRSMADGMPTTPTLRGPTSDTPARDPGEILDPSGRRLVLVLTDGVGDAWRHDLAGPILARWATAMPVAVINLLPQRLWPRTGLAVERAHLTLPAGFKPNRQWSLRLPDAWLDPTTADGTIPIPIVELRPRALASWAQLITGATNGPAYAKVLLTADKPRPYSGGYDLTGNPSATELVDHFRSVASPPAFRLATLLATVPVTLPIAELLKTEMVPEAGPEHLVEVFASGLLTTSSQSTWDAATFDFPEDVRAVLLSALRRSETQRAVNLVAGKFANEIWCVGRLRDAIAAPDDTPDPEFTPDTAAAVVLESVVMRALSGPYLSRADRLRHTMVDASIPGSSASPDAPRPRDTSAGVSNTEAIGLDAVTDRTELASAPDAAHTSQHLDARRERPTETHSGDSDTVSQAGSAITFGFRERQADDAPPIWGNVPPRNPNFTGRVELLDQLSKRLVAGSTTAVLPAALHGMGGIGKTQMAVEYIYRHLRDYDIIWWIQAAQPTQIRSGLTELARALRLPGSNEAHTAVPAVREALRLGQPFRRWLLVFDAAETPESVRQFFPTNGPGEILITSRNPDWAGIARPLEISVFKREESIELLRRRGPDIADEEAGQLAEKLGDLPLAIEQAAAWRAETGMPVTEYLRLFDEKVAEILDTSTPVDYDLSVAAAWNVSFDELRKRNPAAHQILHICAFFAPEPISRDLFTGVRNVTVSPELDVALRDPIQLARAIRDINRYGLAKIDHGNNTILLHRLVQLVLRNRVTPPQLQAQMRHGAHQLLASLDPNDPNAARNWPRYRELLPHAYAAEVIDCDDGWVRQFAINLMRFLFQWGDHEEAYSLAHRAYEKFASSPALGPNHPQTLEVAERLGFYMWVVGRFAEAAALNKRTLELRIKEHGENSEEALRAQLNVVRDLRAEGNFASARKLSEEIFQKSTKLFGPDDPETLVAAFQHGISLRLSGEYAAAAELDEKTHKRRVEVLGFENLDTLSTYSALIVDRRESGDYVWARAEHEKLAELMRERFAEGQADTWVVSFLLAVARRKDGDHSGALELSGPALEQFQNRYGENHPTTMASALAHSIDLRHSRDLAAARSLGEETFERHRNSLGEHHPQTLAATVDLAVTLRLSGDAAGARELDERALEHLREGVGADHPYAIVAAVNLASDLFALGELDAALSLDTEIVDRSARVLGPEHPTSLAVSMNLGLDLRAAGRPKEAEPRYTDTLLQYRKVLGEAHPGTLAAARGVRADCDIDPMLL